MPLHMYTTVFTVLVEVKVDAVHVETRQVLDCRTCRLPLSTRLVEM